MPICLIIVVGVAEGHLLTLVCIAMMAGKRVLTFVTGNPRKLEEVSSIYYSLSLSHSYSPGGSYIR